MAYAMVNRRGGSRYWMAFNSYDPTVNRREFGEYLASPRTWGTVPYETGTIANNQIQNPRLHEERMLLFIQGDTWTGPWTIKRDDHHVITPNGGGSTPAGIRPLFVDVEAAAQALHNRLRGHPTEAPKGAQDDTDDKVIQVVVVIASSILGGISTAFSASGVGYEASAGIFGLASGLVGAVGGDGGSEGPPPPPNIDQIKSTMFDVTDTIAARDAAIQFAETYDWFSSAGQEIASIKGSPPENLVNKFYTRLENALASSDASSFAYTLAHVRDNPSICQYILPHYMLATGLYLTLSRLDFAWMYFPKSNKKPAKGAVSPYAIQRLLDDTKQLRTGLQKAKEQFLASRNNAVVSTGLQRTPESIVPIKVFTKHYFGDEYAAVNDDYAKNAPNGSDFLANVDLSLKDPTGAIGATYAIPKVGQGYSAATKADPIKTALDKLDTIANFLQEDLATAKAGDWPTHLLNIDWDVPA